MRIDNIKLKSAHSEMPFLQLLDYLSYFIGTWPMHSLINQFIKKNISLILSKGINALLISRKSNKSN
jgi:hypothetical protein